MADAQTPPESPEALAERARGLIAAGKRDEAEPLVARAIELKAAELPADRAGLRPQDLARHFAQVAFTGGPGNVFEEVGRSSFITLLEHGLLPGSDLLDIGCGALRLGYWLINFLQPERYCGIEPDRQRVEFGAAHIVGTDVIAAKRPRFDHNLDFDLSVFGRRFDFMVARSIWTHTTRAQIEATLDGFAEWGKPEAVFLVSYVPARTGPGYTGDDWVATPLVEHSFAWIAEACERRRLAARELPGEVNGQVWIRVEHAAAADRPLPGGSADARDRSWLDRLRRG